MAKTRPETIKIYGTPLITEGIASSAIKPGHLVQLGGNHDYQVQGTAKAAVRRSVALENELIGKTIEDAYAEHDRMYVGIFKSGEAAQCRVAASASAVAKGVFLEAAGDGTLRVVTAASQTTTANYVYTVAGVPVAIALEAVDNSANAASDAYIMVEFL
jgi:hypothetical protein